MFHVCGKQHNKFIANINKKVEKHLGIGRICLCGELEKDFS